MHLSPSRRRAGVPKTLDCNILSASSFAPHPTIGKSVWLWLILAAYKIKDLLGSDEVREFVKSEFSIDIFEVIRIRTFYFFCMIILAEVTIVRRHMSV